MLNKSPVLEANTENNSGFEYRSDDYSTSTTSSKILVQFDVKDDHKHNTVSIKKKRESMSSSRECIIDQSIDSRNPKSTGLFGIKLNEKIRRG